MPLRIKAAARSSTNRKERLAKKVKAGQEGVSVPTNMDQSFGEAGVPTHGGYQDAATSSLQTGIADAVPVSVESAIPLDEPQGSSSLTEPLPCPTPPS